MLITPKFIRKPWGSETWLGDGQRTPYAFKLIEFKSGTRSSLQVHRFKHETNHLLLGSGRVLMGRSQFPVEKYLAGMMEQATLEWYIEDLEEIHLQAGDTFDVCPGTIHRVVADTDMRFMETSTPHLDDVIRLQDDTKRGHGKIDAEHT